MLSENQELIKQKLLPEAREEMIDLLKKDEEVLQCGDKHFDFSKFKNTICVLANFCY